MEYLSRFFWPLPAGRPETEGNCTRLPFIKNNFYSALSFHHQLAFLVLRQYIRYIGR
jgi:hypothetical protein